MAVPGSTVRGPLLYGTSLLNSTGLGAPYPYLNGLYNQHAESQPNLVNATSTETPRQFGVSVTGGFRYPGPYVASSIAGGLGTNALTNSGTITQANGPPGGLIVTTGAAATNQASIFTAASAGAMGFPYRAVPGKHLWFSIRFNVTTVTSGGLLLGVADSDPADINAALPNNGIFFTKTAAGTDSNFVVRAASVSTTIANVGAASGVGALANGTNVEYGFLLDAGTQLGAATAGSVSCFVNGKFAGAVPSSDANFGVLLFAATNLGMIIAAEAGGAAVCILNISQFLCVEEL